MAKEEEFTYGYGNISKSIFGSSLAFHIIFATLGVGLSLMIFISEILYHWKKDSDYAIMAKRWTKAFAILLGVAIPTGTIVGVQISLLWLVLPKLLGRLFLFPFKLRFSPSFRSFVHVHLCICS